MEVNLVFFHMSRKAAKESASSHHVHGLAQFSPLAESSDQYPGQGDTAALSLAIPGLPDFLSGIIVFFPQNYRFSLQFIVHLYRFFCLNYRMYFYY